MTQQTPARRLVVTVSVPFCVSRCPHCSRPVLTADEKTRHLYAEALEREIRAAAPDFGDAVVEGICFSGGTPTCLDQRDFVHLARCLEQSFTLSEDPEITVETLPNRVDAAWMLAFQQARVNRLSVNLVTGHAKDAARIGLPASPGSMETTLILPQMFGLRSYEVQLLYGLPGQTCRSFGLSVRFAVQYHAPEITLAPWQPAGEWAAAVPAPEEVEAMLAYADRHLREKGYLRQRPGCWVKPGHSCRMAGALAEGVDHLSFGVGTTSRTEGITYATTSRLGTYLYHADEPDRIYTVLSRQT